MPIRPFLFRELLDMPFALIQANITTLGGLGLAGLLVAEIVVVTLTASFSDLTNGSDAATWWSAVLSTAVCAWLLRYFLRGVTTAIGWSALSGVRIGAREAVRQFRIRALPLLVFQLLFTLVGVSVIVVCSLLIVTAPIALPWLGRLRGKRFVAVPEILAGAGHADAVRHAKVLAAGSEWSLAGLWMTQRALFALVAIPLLGIPLFLTEFTGTHRWQVIVLLTSAVLLLVAFGEIVEASSRMLCYIDLRCRREGLDIRIPRRR
ncbi:hypothetical protein [Nocardia noduli]|uniref:hypothetical protein n=1 Tax=Nocardia noduli TaxID=2815722 RepID=UPI0027E0B83E|nr:hypothetical protein [Nocardia noduli]